MNREILIRVERISKSFQQGAGQLEVLRQLDLTVYKGDALCICGASGSGKSTLLHILGTLDLPSFGKVSYEGSDLQSKSAEQLAFIRNQKMGFVFQFHHLLADFTALENVMMPCWIAKDSPAAARHKATQLLAELGLAERLHHFPSQMSGGEQQRVALARALVLKPDIVFADEPTGNLDSLNGGKIQQLFFSLKERLGMTLVVVTHDEHFAAQFPRRLTLHDGNWLFP